MNIEPLFFQKVEHAQHEVEPMSPMLAVYPSRQEKVEGADGKVRDLSEEKYVARLWQFVSERVGGHAAGQLLQATLSDLGTRIDRVYELSCKGVHAEVSEFESNQCIIQTYLLVGDILRLTDSDAGTENAENAVV